MKLIHAQGNEYVIAVKANQGRLYRQFVEQTQRQSPHSQITQTRIQHGRRIQRTVSTFSLPDACKREWDGASQAVHVHHIGHRQGNPYEAHLYYLTSLNLDAAALSGRIQAHWHIENRLHWGGSAVGGFPDLRQLPVKDVVLQEDKASIQQSSPASLMAILRNLAISLFRAHGYPSIVAAIDLLSHDFDRLLPMLGLSSA